MFKEIGAKIKQEIEEGFDEITDVLSGDFGEADSFIHSCLESLKCCKVLVKRLNG